MEKHSIIIQTAFLGDALLSIPLIKSYKKLYPEHKLTFVCRNGLGELFEKLNVTDSVFELNKKNKSEFNKSIKVLKATKWEHLICPHESIRSQKIALSLNAKIKVGFKKFYNFFIFDKTLNRPMSLPDALRQLSLLSLINRSFKKQFESNAKSYINLNDQKTINYNLQPKISNGFSMQVQLKNENSVLEKLNLKPSAVIIAPGSVWPTKRWTIDGFSELIEKLNDETIYLVGSPNEVPICNQLADKHTEVINLCGKTSLWQLTQLLSSAKCLFSNDSGTMHVASVVNCPTISVFGPTTLSLGYRPWSNNAMVIQKPLYCRPCGKHGHKECPLGTHECMKSIKGSEVYNQAKQIVNFTDSLSH